MSANSAIGNGRLSNNPLFFGTALAETISNNLANVGGWNGDRANNVYSAAAYSLRGGRIDLGLIDSGIFAFGTSAGGSQNFSSHRTILLGY
ncbi:hypothetical protein FWG76_01225 [Candidatus Saccharibacteria bacterium]|nr:hypothetical protein [Candidatus Saccharibacteria bacterium]